MDLTQMLLGLTLLLCSVWRCEMNRCFEDLDQEKEAAEKRLRTHFPHPLEVAPEAAAAEEDSPVSCPVYGQRPVELRDRSLSPWRYVRRAMKDHYPPMYAEAQCLCSGCILIQGKNSPKETSDYNSVPVLQNRVFLKRELCPDGKRYHLKPVNVQVAVGCTCARVKP
ncbi:interleukin-17C [Limanda limanda]|uniref:interleukin-17C n=1 Tax=Limanda limanda TaxID=27771 RepID=UPI0029C6E8BC|nr:interleukin-17C [Limanda limanda]